MVTFPFVGGRLCVDFVNTELIDAGVRVDLLPAFGDVVEWCVRAEVIDAAEARTLRRTWGGRPEAVDAHRRAVAFRRTLRAMLEGLAAGRAEVSTAALDAINGVLREAASERQLARSGDGYALRVRRVVDTPGQLLAAVAESAATLLSSDDLSLVRACQNPECVLFFYDATKNHRRRWCSMAGCGNRAKVAAHYRRAQQPSGKA
jgi:predicted RNA-binding Zn ribbon-like protein